MESNYNYLCDPMYWFIMFWVIMFPLCAILQIYCHYSKQAEYKRILDTPSGRATVKEMDEKFAKMQHYMAQQAYQKRGGGIDVWKDYEIK